MITMNKNMTGFYFFRAVYHVEFLSYSLEHLHINVDDVTNYLHSRATAAVSLVLHTRNHFEANLQEFISSCIVRSCFFYLYVKMVLNFPTQHSE